MKRATLSEVLPANMTMIVFRTPHPCANLASLAVLLLSSLSACTDVRLDIPEEDLQVTDVNDRLTVTGEFCASLPANVEFPVKVMFVVDGSGSLQFSDQNLQRVTAVVDAMNALLGRGNTEFKVITFNATIEAIPPRGAPNVYTQNIADLADAANLLGRADTLTDYQGALALAYNEMLRDMTDVFNSGDGGPAELARSKYMVILISDGLPDPQCSIGLGNDPDPNFPDGQNLLCEDQEFIDCLQRNEDAGVTCSDGVCQTASGRTCFDQGAGNTLFGGAASTELVAGQDYNQPYQILQRVSDIMELGERFQVGDIRVHAGLVLDPLADPAVVSVFGDPVQALPLMRQIAEEGQGEFLEFYGGDSIDFLQLNFDALTQNRALRMFFADNLAALRTEGGRVLDTDFDGISDDEEIELSLNPFTADSDGDGYGDLLELRLKALGLDPKDPCSPDVVDVPGAPITATCDPAMPLNCAFQNGLDANGNAVRIYDDADLDGLHDCEESLLGTRRDDPDTDRDGLPDLVDFRAGLDPLVWDAEGDADNDTIPNAQEIEWHLNPLVQQSEREVRERYRYRRPETRREVDGRPCYEFSVRDIRLVRTRSSDDLVGLGAGYNDIRFFIVEGLEDNPAGTPLVRTACLRTRFLPPLKWPESGEVRLTEANFRYLRSADPLLLSGALPVFNPETDCVDVTQIDVTP